MKSPMISSADYISDEDKGNYTDLQVLQSGAGFYIGTLHQTRDDDGNLLYESPGSRDSDYFPTRESASKALDAIREALPGQDGLFAQPKSNFF